jgi:hypothetical protein
MKRVLLTVLILLCISASAFSQDGIEAPLLEKLGFTEAQIEAVEEIRYEAQKTIQVAQAELEIVRARLKKLLLDAGADMREVEAMLREAMTYELKIRLTQIEQELKIRRLLGEENWDKLVRAMRSRGQRPSDLQERPQQEKMKPNN